jgi:hypothetical protein
MQWIKNSLASIKEASSSEPMQCPRGWGEVSFHLSVDGFFPAVWDVSRKCPIGGVESCQKCRHPYSPDASARLREDLEELQVLLRDGVLTKEEHAQRRTLILGLHEGTMTPPGYGFRVTAWILAPVGILLTGTGLWLAAKLHPGFWGMALAGVLVLGLCISFAALAHGRAKGSEEKHSRPYG